MVTRDFDEKTDVTKQRGICDKIKNYPSLVRDILQMVNDTETEGREHIMTFMIKDGREVITSGVEKGTEDSLSLRQVMQVKGGMMGKVGTDAIQKHGYHQVHTHPGKIADLSLNDMTAIANEEETSPVLSSTLVATAHPSGDNSKAIINGLERVSNMPDDQVSDLVSVANAVKTMTNRGRISSRLAKNRLLDELQPYYQDCSSVIEM